MKLANHGGNYQLSSGSSAHAGMLTFQYLVFLECLLHGTRMPTQKPQG